MTISPSSKAAGSILTSLDALGVVAFIAILLGCLTAKWNNKDPKHQPNRVIGCEILNEHKLDSNKFHASVLPLQYEGYCSFLWHQHGFEMDK